MQKKTHIVVLHAPAGGGHRAAANALAEAAPLVDAEVEVLDALAYTPPWFAKSYVQTHLRSTRHAPWAYGFGYDRLNQRHRLADGIRHRVDRKAGRLLTDAIARSGADVVVATHFFALSVLGQAKRRGELTLPLVGVVTDHAAHAFWAERGVDLFCVPSAAAARDLRNHGIAHHRIATTGIPIRPAFGEVAPLPSQLPSKLEVLVTSGGFGIGPMARTIRSFAGITDVHLTVVCGANEDRVHDAHMAARAARVPATIIGYENDMPRRIGASHVVVGKPGGLTVSEATACGRPMVLVGACPGQEEGNQKWLCHHGAAVAAHPDGVGLQLEWLRRNDRLTTMANASHRLGCRDAARRVLESAIAGRYGLVAA